VLDVNKATTPFRASLLAGLLSGALFGLFSPKSWVLLQRKHTVVAFTVIGMSKHSIRISYHVMLELSGWTGAVLGAGEYFASELYSQWQKSRSSKTQNREEEFHRQFLKDKEKYGDDAYFMERRLEKSTLPKWWPIRKISDAEYEELLQKKIQQTQDVILANKQQQNTEADTQRTSSHT